MLPDPAAQVTLMGPTSVAEQQPVTLTCKTSPSNPPSDLVWTIDSK